MTILDLLFPKKCLGCGRTGAYFCSDCLNFVSLDFARICPVCERSSIGGMTHPRCQTGTSLDGLTSIFTYKGIMKKAIAKLKYKFVSDLATDLVEIFLSFCGEDKTFSDVCQKKDICLVPIPLHQARQNWRGFNQSELLGKMIVENLSIGFVPGLLKRVKNTKPQIKLKEKERKKNIQDAFVISPNYLAKPDPALRDQLLITNYSFLLFDDVWTSGATLKEAGKVLKQSGAKFVWGLTLVR